MTWNRIVEEDIQKSLDCGVKFIHMSAPVSDIHIYKKLNKMFMKYLIKDYKNCLIKSFEFVKRVNNVIK